MFKRTRWLILATSVLMVLFATPIFAHAVTPTYSGVKWGAYGTGNFGFNVPADSACDGWYWVVVPDFYNNQVKVYNPSGGFDISFGATGSALGQFNNPRAVAFDRQDRIFVTDESNNRIQRFDGPSTSTVLAFGSGLAGPAGIAVDINDFVYVADSGHNRIVKYRTDGSYVTQWPSPNGPAGVAVDAMGKNVYVASFGNMAVYKYTSTGATVTTIGSGLGNPASVEVDPRGFLWVAEMNGFQRILRYSVNGGAPLDIYTHGSTTADGDFANLFGLGLNGMGVYGSDYGNCRIQRLNPGIVKPVNRETGFDRYRVAIQLAKTKWPNYTSPTYSGIKTLIVACGTDAAMADPLCSGGLAGIEDAPILLTPRGLPLNKYTDDAVKAIRAANGPLKIYVVGGTGSVPTVAYNRLKALNSGGTIKRLGGADRYAVSVSIAKEMISEAAAKNLTINAVLIVNGLNTNAFWDDLAASPLAAAGHAPMLAVSNTKVSNDVYQLVHGTLASKTKIAVSAGSYLPTATVYAKTACAGRLTRSLDRFTAARDIATSGREDMGLTYWNNVAIAKAIPDALTGGAWVGRNGGVLLYTNKDSLPSVDATFLAAPFAGHEDGTFAGWVLGGTGSVSDATMLNFYSKLQ